MSLELRQYQRDGMAAVRAAYAEGARRMIVVMPCGAGKTVLFATLLKLRSRPGAVQVVLAHRDELVQQACDKIATVVPELRVGVVKAERNEITADVIVASIQTLTSAGRLGRVLEGLRRPGMFDGARQVRTVVADECHHMPLGPNGNTFGNVLTGLGALDGGELLTLGVTATPDPLIGPKGLAGGWEKIVYQLDILDGIKGGWLVDVRAKEITLAGADFNQLHSRGGEIREEEAGAMFLDANGPAVAVQAWLDHAAGMQTIAFTAGVNTAHVMAETFRQRGVKAAAVDGSMPIEKRREILADYEAGRLQVVANCAVLTEGFDSPQTQCVLMARPTKSRPFALQCIGRALRPYPGKAFALVLDIVGATVRKDLMTVSAMFKVNPKKAGEGVLHAIQEEEIWKAGAAAAGQRKKLDAREVKLFGRQAFAWVHVEDRWVVTMGSAGDLMLVPSPGRDGRFDVVKRERGKGTTRLYVDLDLGYAMGTAEDILRKSGAAGAALKNAAWRRDPPSDGQRALLEKHGRWRDGMTRGDASTAITVLTAGWGR